VNNPGYLTDALTRITNGYPINWIDDLMPRVPSQNM
jgi:hypothetical protein